MKMSEESKAKKMRAFKKQARHFAVELERNKKRSPSIMQIVNFKMWQTRAGIKDINNKDYKFFNDNNLVTKAYFYDTKISKFKLLVAGLLFRLLKVYINKEMGSFTNI